MGRLDRPPGLTASLSLTCLGASFANVPGGTANWVFTAVTGNYNDISGSVEIVINKAEQTIQWSDPDAILQGISRSADQLNATVSGVAGG